MDSQLHDAGASRVGGGNSSRGIVTADSNGLCLGAFGALPASVAGFASSMATRAQSLSSEPGDTPTLTVESSVGKLVIRKDEGVTTAVLM